MIGNYITIVIGSSRNFFVDLNYPDSNDPLDLTGVEEISVSLPAASGGAVTVDETDGVAVVGSPGSGRIAVDLTAEKSALLLTNPSQITFQDLQVKVIDGSGQIIVLIMSQVLNILTPEFPIV